MLENIIYIALGISGLLGAVFMGYWMGRKTITDEPLVKREFDPGPPNEPDGDMWTEALTAPEEERGIPTT